jgi:hypothetical protein
MYFTAKLAVEWVLSRPQVAAGRSCWTAVVMVVLPLLVVMARTTVRLLFVSRVASRTAVRKG